MIWDETFTPEAISLGLGTFWWTCSLTWTLLSGAFLLLDIKLPENALRRFTQMIATFGLFLSVIMASLLAFCEKPVVKDFGHWYHSAEFSFDLVFGFDGPSAFFLTVSHLIFLAVVRYSANYLHREQGYQRFMFLLSLFQLGVLVTATSGNLDALFAGWELVGLSSICLIWYFRELGSAARASQFAFSVYKITDLGILFGGMILHHALGSTSFNINEIHVNGNHDPHLILPIAGLLLIFGSLGKSAQFPFHSWMPRAMEGPTPSSGLFYGAISVHLGVLMLVKTWEIWSPFLVTRWTLGIIGLVTFVISTMSSLVHPNLKGRLAQQSISQVSLMYIELSLGLRYFVVWHLCGHAFLRTYQYLRSADVLAMDLRRAGTNWMSDKLYVHAYNNFYAEHLIRRFNHWCLSKLKDRSI